MALPARTDRLTPEEYLERERQAEFRSEYAAGEVFALAGASEPHNLLVTNCVAELRQQLKGRPCKLFANDMRVHLPKAERYVYPDLAVVCGEALFTDAHRDTLINPTLIIEILSPSTEAYDRGAKFESYRTLDSLRTYLLIAQDRVHVEVFERREDGRWLLSEAKRREDEVALPTVGCKLSLREVYDGVFST